MARFVDAIDLPLPPEEAFDYLAEFSHTEEWDPGVVSARRLGAGPVQAGSRFEVEVSFLGRRLVLEYAITACERPWRLVLEGGNADLRSVDEITFAPRPGGTRVTYEARLELAGLRRLADPLLDAVFQRVGRAAAAGLAARFAPASGARRRAGAPRAASG